MDSSATDGAAHDSRRYRLAWRLMVHQVRTGTISAMTGLSRHQQETLRRRWGIPERARLRGPSPTSLVRFTRSPRARSEAAVLAAFCRVYGALLPGNMARVPRARLLTLELGERLCPTYEAFRACFPQCVFELEELLSLVIGIAKNKIIGLDRCPSCSATVIVDRLGPNRPTCSYCQQSHLERPPNSQKTVGIELLG